MKTDKFCRLKSDRFMVHSGVVIQTKYVILEWVCLKFIAFL